MYKFIQKIVFVLLSALAFSMSVMAYEVETDAMYIRYVGVGQQWNTVAQLREGLVNFAVVEESPDLCLTGFNSGAKFSFRLSEGVGYGVERDTDYGKSFLAVLLLAKTYNLPVRIRYESDAGTTFPQLLDNCSATRYVPIIKWIGLDKPVVN